MSTRDQMPALTRFTFGTGRVSDKHNAEHIAVIRAAMDAGVWFHTSHVYGDGAVFATLRTAFDQDPSHIPPCIFKVDGKSPELLRTTVDDSLRGLGVERLDLAQVCGNPDAAGLYPGGALHEAMSELRDEGKVGGYTPEIFSAFSANLCPAVADDLFESVIFYYNLTEREVSNPLWAVLVQKQTPILALRTLGGGTNRYGRFDEAAREELERVYERSGCTSQFEFRFRFPLSVPQVRTTIGATATLEHLDMLLQANAAFEPLPADVVHAIQALHSQWFAA